MMHPPHSRCERDKESAKAAPLVLEPSKTRQNDFRLRHPPHSRCEQDKESAALPTGVYEKVND